MALAHASLDLALGYCALYHFAMVRGQRTLGAYICEVASITFSYGVESWLSWSHCGRNHGGELPDKVQEGTDLFLWAVLCSAKDLVK